MATNVQFLTAYLIVDVFCIVLTAIIAGSVRRDSGSETQVRYLFLVLAANLAFIITDAIWAMLMFDTALQFPPVVPAVFNGVNKVAVAFAGYFWFCYSLARFNSQLVHDRRLRLIAAIPVMVVPVMYIVGFVMDLNFTIDPGGETENGPMYIAITIIGLGYLVAATVAALIHYRRATVSSEKRTCLVFVSFMIAPAAAAIYDVFIPNMPVMAPAMLVSILLVFLSLQESRISNDALTGLNNRRRADAYLEESLARASHEQPVYLFIVDMDRFKEINDVYGHLEGDRALQLMANALRATCSGSNAFAARWGGDEFVLICVQGANEIDPANMVNTIQERLSDMVRNAQVAYTLSCTVGYAKCEAPTKDTRTIISEADHMLYENKTASRK